MDRFTQEEWQKFRYTASFFVPAQTLQALDSLISLVSIALGWASITVEVFTRRPGTFGVRYLSWVRGIMAVFIISIFTAIMGLISLFTGGPMALMMGRYFKAGSPLFTIYYWAFIFMLLYHKYTIYQREKSGIDWHSQSFGVSWLNWLPFNISDWVLYRFVEPGLFFMVAFVVLKIDTTLGTWLVIGAMALLLRNSLVYLNMRGKVLDLIDARIEAEHFTAAIAGADKRETAGFAVIPIPSAELEAAGIDLSSPTLDSDEAQQFVSEYQQELFTLPPEPEPEPQLVPEIHLNGDDVKQPNSKRGRPKKDKLTEGDNL